MRAHASTTVGTTELQFYLTVLNTLRCKLGKVTSSRGSATDNNELRKTTDKVSMQLA